MPTNDPIGSLFKAAGLVPVRSTPKSSSPADATKDAPQPTRGFLSSLRKVQRDGSNPSRTSTTSDNDAKFATPATPATPKDPTDPEARQVAPNEADAPLPVAPPADDPSASLVAFVAEASAAAEAVAIVVEPVPQVAPTDPSVATDVPLLQVADEIPSPVPSQAAPAARRSAFAMPSALQQWLSAKPATAAKVETTAAAAPMPPETGTTTDTAPGDATATMPPGLQLALSAAMASQAATQSGSPTKASTDAPVATVSTAQPAPIVVAAVSPANLPPTESGPTAERIAPEIPAAAQELPAQASATVPLQVAAPVTEVVAAKVATAAAVEPAKEKHPAAAQDAGTPTVPTVSPLAIPVPAVTVPQAFQPEVPKTDEVPQAATQISAAVGPQNVAATPEITTAAQSSASSARKSDSKQAPIEISAATTDVSSGPDPIVFETIVTPARGERTSATAQANEAVPETILPSVATQDPAGPQAADSSSLGPLTAGRNESPAVADPTIPVVQVSPHDSQALVDRVSQLVLKSHDSGQQLSLQITPPDMGTVRIEVHSHGGVLTARLEADSPAARQLLAEHLPQLREALQQQGASVDRIDVYQSDHSAPGESMADSNWQSPQQDQRTEAAPLLYDDEEVSEPGSAESRGSLALGELNIRV